MSFLGRSLPLTTQQRTTPPTAVRNKQGAQEAPETDAARTDGRAYRPLRAGKQATTLLHGDIRDLQVSINESNG